MEVGKMEYVYAAMLLHKAGKEINEENIKKVLEAAGVQVDTARIKALVASLEGVNIDEVIEKAQSMQVTAASAGASAGGSEQKEEKKEEKKKEEKPSVEQAAAGLGALFG